MSVQKAPGSTVARMVANGMNILNIEVETGWAPDDIKELAREQGFALNVASGRFQKAPVPKPAPLGIVRHQPGAGVALPQEPTPPAVEEPTATPAPTLNPASVISAGLAHTDEHIRGLATTARDTITALAAALVEYEQRGEALAEVARLEEALAAARVRAGIKPRPPVNPEAKVIRAWAAENGVPCTRTGIVPAAVREAYRAAMEGVAS